MGRKHLVMIVDQDPDFRAEVAAMLKSAPVAVVADSGYGVEATSLAEDTQPDLILAAVEQPFGRAVQTIRAVHHLLPECPIIAYSSTNDLSVLRPVLQAGVSDFLPRPLQPKELLRAVGHALSGEGADGGGEGSSGAGTVLTVVGAKGGVGKSTIATNLAAAIARDTDYNVLLIDLDTRFGDVAIMLDIEPRFTIADLAGSVDSLDRQTFRSALLVHSSGVQILPAPRHPGQWRNISGAEIRALVEYAARLFDYVILDTPGTFNEIVATALDVAGEVLVISSLDLASLKDTAYMLELLGSEGYPAERLRVILNDATNARMIGVDDAQQAFDQAPWWDIPYDAQVSLAAQLGQPVVLAKPKCRAARRIAGLCTKITGGEAQTREERSAGGVRRLLSIPRLGRRRERAPHGAA